MYFLEQKINMNKNTREDQEYIAILIQLYPLINLLNHRVNIMLP